MGPEGMAMRLLLGALLCALVVTAACAAPDPTVPAPPTSSPVLAAHTTPADARLQLRHAAPQEIAPPTISKADVINLSPSVEDSSMHADVGDLVSVQVDLSGNGQCQPLKVKDPFGNVVVEMASNETRGQTRGRGGVKFQGAFFAAVAGEYVVELGHESRNLNCGVRSSSANAEVKWTVQPR